MIERGGNPRVAGVAIAAFRRGGHVICRLAGRRCAVVAAGARALHLRVIHLRYRHPGISAVASLAHVAGSNVRRRLAHRRGAVVTRGAVVDDAGVVEGRGNPRVGRVASTALGGSRHVIGRFTRRYRTVVATQASPLHLGVIDIGRRPCRAQVTALA